MSFDTEFKKITVGVDCPDKYNIGEIEVDQAFTLRKTCPRAIITFVEMDIECKCFRVNLLIAKKSIERFHLDSDFVEISNGLFKKKSVVLKLRPVVDPIIVKKEEDDD